MNEKNPPVARGVFLLVLSGLLLACHTLHLPFFDYRRSYLSQEIFILLFLDLLVVYLLVGRSLQRVDLNLIHCCGLFGLGVAIATNSGDLLAYGIVLMYLLLLILGQFLSRGRFILLSLSFAAIIATQWSFLQYLGGRMGVLGMVSHGRMYGVYGQPNLLACLILLGMACWCHLLLELHRRRLIHFLPLFILASGLFLTASRAAMLALAVASLFVFLVVHRKQHYRHLYGFFGAVGSTVVAAYAAVSLFGAHSPLGRNASELAVEGGSVNTYQRFNDWYSAFQIGMDHFWSGAGIGHFKMLLGKYSIETAEALHFTYDSISQTLWAHNDFLHIFAENGFVVAGLLLFAGWLLVRHAIATFSGETVFPLFAVLAFAIMMCFGHPFRYHALVFSLMLIFAQLLRNARPVVVLGRRMSLVLVLGTLVLINLVMAQHFNRSYNLGRFVSESMNAEEYSAESYFRAKQKYLGDALNDSLYAWQFLHETYAEMTQHIFNEDDRVFAVQILPEMLDYAEHNNFASYSFLLARIFYITGDYASSMAYARQAYDRDPEKDVYFDFVHVNQVLMISRDNDIPLDQLFGAETFQSLCETGVLKERQFEANRLVAL